MKKNERFSLFGLLLALLVTPAFPGCSLSENDDPIAVKGTWKIPNGNKEWEENWVITDISIDYAGNYKADIVKFDNRGLNGKDTAIVNGGTDRDVGFAVIKYTEVDNAGSGTVGKYQIFRWGTNSKDASKRDFTQGYKNVGAASPNNVNEVFDSIAAAEEGATIAAAHFSAASTGAIKQ